MPKKALVVLGAGASHDCYVRGILPSGAVKMPLVDQLFEERLFKNIIADMRSRGAIYDGASAMGHLYMSAKNKQHLSLEKFLDNILINKKDDKSYHRYVKNVRQLVSYMRTLIGGIGTQIRAECRHTGYHNLVNHFSTPDYDKVVFLTTNYDGSVNWVRVVTKEHYPALKDGSNDELVDTICSIDPASTFIEKINIDVYSNHYESRWNAGTVLYPVMVLPTILGKKYVCPKEHVDTIIPIIRDVTEVWIIGNSMADDDLASLIKEQALNTKDVHLIDRVLPSDTVKNERIKKEICERVANLFPKSVNIHTSFIGFSTFVRDHLDD